MAKVIEMRVRGLICSIPLSEAVYCENCVAISNSPPDQCGVCGSEGVLRIEPILDRPPAPSPVAAMRAASPLPGAGSLRIGQHPQPLPNIQEIFVMLRPARGPLTP
jgi:hypothetical protein